MCNHLHFDARFPCKTFFAKELQLGCTFSAQVQMYGYVVVLVFSSVWVACMGICEAYYDTCVYGASMALEQIINRLMMTTCKTCVPCLLKVEAIN